MGATLSASYQFFLILAHCCEHTVHRALARILKLPVIYERLTIQNGLKRSKMGYNCIKWSKMVIFLPVKTKITRQQAWQVLVKALTVHHMINCLHTVLPSIAELQCVIDILPHRKKKKKCSLDTITGSWIASVQKTLGWTVMISGIVHL